MTGVFVTGVLVAGAFVAGVLVTGVFDPPVLAEGAFETGVLVSGEGTFCSSIESSSSSFRLVPRFGGLAIGGVSVIDEFAESEEQNNKLLEVPSFSINTYVKGKTFSIRGLLFYEHLDESLNLQLIVFKRDSLFLSLLYTCL